MPDVMIRPMDLDRDAEGLAAMWNASDLQWPGSWTRGAPYTIERVCRTEDELRKLAVYVAEVDGEIAGYCSFIEGFMGHEGEGYLALLNVHPRFQKLSLGRKLVQATIDYAVERGWQRQALNTWPANSKAMSAYKKTGHFWAPGTSVYMQCFIPGALQLPLAKPFFERHNWYACFVREIKQEPDDEHWEGLKVYTQHWQAKGGALTIRIDREARAPVAVETDTLLVAAIIADSEPLAGSAVPLRWRIANKGQEQVQVYLHAMGDEGLVIDHRDAFVVAAGETVERLAQVKVADDAPRAKGDGSAPAVRSILRLNDQEVELYSGVRARKPISLDTAPSKVTLAPNVPTTVNLQVHSELGQAVELRLLVTVPEGLSADWTQTQLQVPMHGHMSVPITLTASGEGVYPLTVHMACTDGVGCKPVHESLTLFSLGSGRVLAHREGDDVRLETDALRLTAGTHDRLTVEHKASRLTLASWPQVGPPYFPSDFEKTAFAVEIEEHDGRAMVSMAGKARYHEGLYLCHEISLSAAGPIAMRYWLENRGYGAHRVRFRLNVGTPDRPRELLTLPLKMGTVQSPGSLYPNAWEDAPPDPADYAEPWMAWEHEGLVGGLAWDSSVARISGMNQYVLDSRELEIGPGQRSREICFALTMGEGDWRHVRQETLRWAGLAGGGPGSPSAALPVRPPVLARLEPAVVATISNEASARLVVDSASSRAESGQVVLVTDEALLAEPAAVRVTDLRRGRPLERTVRFSLPEDVLGVLGGEVQMSLPTSNTSRPFHVLRLGTPGAVMIGAEGEGSRSLWTIHNGPHRFVIAPGFGPSMIAWYRDKVNCLASSFPVPQGLGWLYPWFGGLGPGLAPVGPYAPAAMLHREHFDAEVLCSTDTSGLAWQGVRLRGRSTQEAFRDLALEVDYLTLGQAKVLKYVYRLYNLRGTEQAVRTFSRLTCSLGGDIKALTLRGEGLVRQPTTVAATVQGRQWGALTDDRTGRTMLLVGRQADIALEDWGQAGRLLGADGNAYLAGGAVQERIYYLVLAESLEEALDYLPLADYAG